MTVKTFQLTVFIGKPQPEHQQIKTAVEKLSNNNCVVVNLHAMGICMLFRTHLNLAQIFAHFDKILLRDDKVLLTEVGKEIYEYRLDKALAWLQKNHPK